MSKVIDLRNERLKRANRRLQHFDNAGAAEDLRAARYLLCATRLPGATLREIAIMTRQQKPARGGRGGDHDSNSSRRQNRKRR